MKIPKWLRKPKRTTSTYLAAIQKHTDTLTDRVARKDFSPRFEIYEIEDYLRWRDSSHNARGDE